MWIARLTATSPHTHSPAKRQTFLNLDYNVKTDRSDSNLNWNGLLLLTAAIADGVPCSPESQNLSRTRKHLGKRGMPFFVSSR
jgi:hypothetical protein